MLIESIILVIFVCSFGGVIFILVRKTPSLSLLPHNGSLGIRKHRIILNTESKIKQISVSFKKQIFLHKFLSWVKVMALKIETRTDVLLHKIRNKAQQVEKEINDKK